MFSKLFVDDRLKMAWIIRFVFHKEGNSVKEGENAGFYTFSSLQNFFYRLFVMICQNMGSFGKEIHSLPKDKILDWTKLKTFADNKLDIATKLISGCDSIENIVGKKTEC